MHRCYRRYSVGSAVRKLADDTRHRGWIRTAAGANGVGSFECRLVESIGARNSPACWRNAAGDRLVWISEASAETRSLDINIDGLAGN